MKKAIENFLGSYQITADEKIIKEMESDIIGRLQDKIQECDKCGLFYVEGQEHYHYNCKKEWRI